jgi:hypothetical protein
LHFITWYPLFKTKKVGKHTLGTRDISMSERFLSRWKTTMRSPPVERARWDLRPRFKAVTGDSIWTYDLQGPNLVGLLEEVDGKQVPEIPMAL